jgi:hypothetical protein
MEASHGGQSLPPSGDGIELVAELNDDVLLVRTACMHACTRMAVQRAQAGVGHWWRSALSRSPRVCTVPALPLSHVPHPRTQTNPTAAGGAAGRTRPAGVCVLDLIRQPCVPCACVRVHTAYTPAPPPV